jgi:predicted permease
VNPFDRKPGSPNPDQDLTEELQAHLNLAEHDHVARGESVVEAKAHAKRDLGNELLIKETTRANWAWISLEQIGKDLRYAARQMMRSPGFSLTVILTLALGIGANTAIFSLANQLLLHPVGIDHPERLVAIREHYDKLNLRNIPISAPAFKDTLNSRQIFEHAAAAEQVDFNYSDGSTVQRLQGAIVSSEWFDVFGAKPVLGRVFTADEDQPNANRVAVLSYNGWTRLFGADRSVIGRTIELNRLPYRIIGVMQEGFEWTHPADLWTPIAFSPEQFSEENRFNETYLTVARMRPGVAVAQADQWIRGLSERVMESQARGASEIRNLQWGMFAQPFLDLAYGDSKISILLLLGAVGVVLLIASSNVAGLMLARNAARSQEIALQAALGANRWRLLCRICADSVLLAFVGGIAGLATAFGGMKLLLWLSPADQVSGLVARIDGITLLFTAGAVIASTLLFGLLPAWQSSSVTLHAAMTSIGRSATANVSRQKMRSALVIGESALALVLLVTAGAFYRSYTILQQVDPGFNTAGIMTATFSLPATQYKTEESRATFFRQVLEHLGPGSGPKAASIAMGVPFTGVGNSGAFEIEGESGPGAPPHHSDLRWVTPGFFQTLQIPLKQGRWFDDGDRTVKEPRVVIDEYLAHQTFPGKDPVGKKLKMAGGGPWFQIVGVVGHTLQSDLAVDTGKGTIYFNLYHAGPIPFATILAKTDGDPIALTSAIRAAVREADPNQPVHTVKTMQDLMANTLGQRRFVMQMMSFFALTALVLAALGLYGIIHYGVTQRTREIGLRVALGAGRSSVLGLIISQGLRLAGIGIGLGLLAAAGISGVLESQLFHVRGFDPLVAGIAAVVLLLVALAASYVPARRAASVDPAIALRNE